MNTNDLYTFIKASELLNFSKTAEELNYSQSAVTIQIQKLEKEFSVQLFNRIGKNISLTPAGKQFLIYAHNILNQVELAKEIMGSKKQIDNQIKIGSISSLSSSHLPLVFKQISSSKQNINMNIITSSPSELFSLLNKDKVDLVYIFDKSIYSEKWIKVFDKKEKLHFVSSDPNLKGKKLKIQDIINFPFYLTEKYDNYRLALDTKLAEQNLEVFPVFEITNTDIILNVLKENKGISFLPEFVYVSHLENQNLFVLDIEDFDLELSRQLFFHKNKFVSKEMKEIIRLIDEI